MKTNQDMYRAVWLAMRGVVGDAVYWTMTEDVDVYRRAVSDAVFREIHRDVDWNENDAVYRDVSGAVDNAVYGPLHPSLAGFLSVDQEAT